ncbi:MAG: Dabb family protein [Nitrospinae bacterium]|nr:Dabb family protein [Nitrospinota bacterium]
MIRHIVFFKFKKGVSQKEMDALAEELCALKSHIHLLREMEVCFDRAHMANSYDMALNSLFDTMEDMEKYAAHPAHVKVLATIRILCESHVKVDYQTMKVAM